MRTPVETKIIVHADTPGPLIDIVCAEHPDVIIEGCSSYSALPETIKTFRPDVVYSIRFAGTPNFPADALLGPNGPRWISVGGSGVDHLGRWNPEKVQVTNSAGVAAHTMAEYVLGGFLHFSLDVPGLLADRHHCNWRADRTMQSLSGKTLLIIGLGHTGRAIAARAKAFGMHIIGTKASARNMSNVDRVYGSEALPSLWAQADFVAVCVPLLERTRGLVDEEAFQSMKKNAILADVSRGGVVDQAALVSALETGSIAGAVLDVFETEPLPDDHRLWQFPNVILSPHCSSVFNGWEQASVSMFCENLTRWRKEEPLQNLITPSKGY